MNHIVIGNTRDVIFESIRSSTSTLDKTNGHNEFTETDDGFYALLGSVLFSRASLSISSPHSHFGSFVSFSLDFPSNFL